MHAYKSGNAHCFIAINEKVLKRCNLKFIWDLNL